jgi:hypothetical protein
MVTLAFQEAAMPKHSSQTNEKANFVFKGTIKKLKSATMGEVPLSDRTVVVRVDEVIDGPPDLTGFLGQEITVELSGDGAVSVGQKMVFHTTGWMFGASVAVRSVREEAAKSSGMKTSRTGGAGKTADANAAPPAHFSDADLVVSGKVVSVRIPRDTGARKRTTKTPSPITEHDPVWREAVIQVDDVLKGEKKAKRITVRFPDSSDVMFHGVPRFEPGQEGYFMLHKGEATKSPAGRAQKSKSADTYFALDAQDFQPFVK